MIIRTILKRDYLLEIFLKNENISILSHSGHLGSFSHIKSVGWIPDFQHIYLPEFFSAKEIRNRNKQFHELCNYCCCIIVSSNCAKNDLYNFNAACYQKSVVLNFVTGRIDDKKLTPIETLKDKYGFDSPYFYVPNQFWAHKNHKLIIEALKLLKSTGHSNITVVLSGNTSDHRQQNYFSQFMHYMDVCGVKSMCKVIGLIAYNDVLSLMKYSAAVINPSLFEGWSTTVEEAKTMGKLIILSDIPVHREQAPPQSIYIDPKKPNELADAMLMALSNNNPTGNLPDHGKAQTYEERRREFINRFQEIILHCMKQDGN